MSLLPIRPGPVRSSRPDVDGNRSWWTLGQPSYVPSPPLCENVVADMVIIGGGFTGMSTAWHVARRFPDRRVALIEAREVGNGASGRNGGMMLNWMNGVSSSQPELTRLVYQTTKAGIDDIVSLIEGEKLAVPYRRDGCLELITNPQRAEAAAQEVQRLQSWGIGVEWLDARAVRKYIRAEGVYGGIFDRSVGQVHGLALLREMKKKMPENVVFYENSPVLKVEEGASILVSTAQGSVRAPVMVLGTNGYTPRLGYFRSRICPMHSHIIATDPLPPEAWEALGWGQFAGFCDDLDRIAYGSMSPDGSLIFGGGGNYAYAYRYNNGTSYPEEDAQAGFEGIRRRLMQYLPGLERLPLRRTWTGTLGVTLDRSCTMGVRGEYKNVYYALGYSGHGVTLANLAGKVLCDLYSDNHEAWKNQPFYQNSLYPMPGEPLRWIGYQLFTRLTGRSPRRRS